MPPLSVFLDNHPRPAQSIFKDAVSQVSQFLSKCQSDPATSRVLADYFLRSQPEVTSLPFGVALAHATILYHLKLHRPSTSDLENITALLNTIFTLASDAEIAGDTTRVQLQQQGTGGFFFEEVVRGAIFGLPPRSRHVQRRSGQLLTAQPHFVVLLPAPLFDSFSFIACNLACGFRSGALREEWLSALAPLVSAPAVLVSLRARLLQMRCSPLTARQHAAEVVQAVSHNAEALPTEAVALVFDHLRLAVSLSEADRTTEEHALCIAASTQLLELQAPVRRKYVESYLYPALRDARMEQMLSSKTDTAAQIGKQLLRLMSGNSSGCCPFYLSACALFQRMLRPDSPLRGAMFLVSLCQLVMPEGGTFVASLAADSQMDSDYFAQIIFEVVGALTEAIDFATGGGDDDDDDDDNENSNGGDPESLSPVAKLIDRGGTSLFVKILFMLRLIVSQVVSTSSAAVSSSAETSGRSSLSSASAGSNVLSLSSHNRRGQQQQGLLLQQQQRPDALVADLRTALSRDIIHKIGAFVENVVLPSAAAVSSSSSSSQNGGGCGADVSARVLVVEIAMLLHHEFVDETIGRVRDFLAEQLASKTSDAATSPGIVSHMNRVLLALADSPTARDRFATTHCAMNWLRHDPLDPVTHVMVLNVMARCPTPNTRLELFDTLYPTIIASVLPAVRKNLVGAGGDNDVDVRGVEDCAGASSALVMVTRMMLMVRPTGPASSSSGGNGNGKNQQQQQLAKRLCVDIAMIASAIAASNRMALKNHVALVLWWSSLSLLRFGGEKTSVAVSSAGNNDASSACYHLFTALRYVHCSFPKLVGIATTRLVMDFCLHAPIIIDNLVSVLDENPQQLQQHQQQQGRSRRRRNKNGGGEDGDGVVRVADDDETLIERYSLALREDSPFRTWLRKHIVRSVPSRTALLIAYAQCIASRVRVHRAPHELRSFVGERAFSAMMTETVLATDRQACEVFCKSATAWLRGDACPKMTTPGPFLMVICALLSLQEVAPASSRARGRIQEALQQQAPRVATVAETLRHDAPAFSRFAANICAVCSSGASPVDGSVGGGGGQEHLMFTDDGTNSNSNGNNNVSDPYRQHQQQQENQLPPAQADDDDDNNNDYHAFDDGDDGQLDNDDGFVHQSQQQQQQHQQQHRSNLDLSTSAPAPPLVNTAPQHHHQPQRKRSGSSASHHSGKENKRSAAPAGVAGQKKSSNNENEDAREFHVDTWEALQRQSCQSLLFEVRNIMQSDFGQRVGGPDAEDVIGGAEDPMAYQQHMQLTKIQRMMMTGSAGEDMMMTTTMNQNNSDNNDDGSASLTPGHTAATWQQQQSYRTALREVRGLLVPTSGGGGGNGNTGGRMMAPGGVNVDLI